MTEKVFPSKSAESSSPVSQSDIMAALKKSYEKSFGRSLWNIINVFSWPENISILLKNFIDEMKKLTLDKIDVKKTTTEALKKQLDKVKALPKSAAGKAGAAIAGVIGSASSFVSSKFSSSAEKQEGEKQADQIFEDFSESLMEGAELDQQDSETFAGFANSYDSVSQSSPSGADTVEKLVKLADSDDPSPEALSKQEMRNLSALSIKTFFVELKSRFKTESEFSEYLGKLFKLRAKIPKFSRFLTYFKANFENLFRLEEEEIPEFLGIDSTAFMGLMLPWKSESDKQSEAISIIADKLFPRSVGSSNGAQIKPILLKIYRTKAVLPSDIAKLAFLIETDEWIAFSDALSNPKS